ncbi:hypothetical protein T11_13499, partial [Trichinella zimbabwensis]
LLISRDICKKPGSFQRINTGNTTTLEAIYPTTTALFPVKLSKTQ